MRKISACIIALLSLMSLRAFAQTDSFRVDGVYRNYSVHLPAAYNASTAHPLVLNLHGYTSNAQQEEIYTQMDASSDQNNYIVVYPNGIANYWNSWGPAGTTYGANDVKFLTELIDTISARYHVNPKRVYSCGMSNGGYMTYTLACNLANKLAAIASVAGTMSNYTYAHCNVSRHIPVMHVHGTTDPVVSYATGANNSIGAEQTVAFWRDTDACATISDTTALPNTSQTDGSTVQVIRYQNCPANNEVLFYKITGGGHTWPGGFIDIGSNGNTNRDISATDEIWNFFNRYTLDGLATGVNEISTVLAVQVSPNPAGNKLQISSEADVTITHIYDLTGRIMISAEKTQSIDIESINSGIYIAVVTTQDGQQHTVKFTKQ